MAPASVTVSMLRMWIEVERRLRVTSTSRRRSLRQTSAARATRSVVLPVAIAARLRIEHGTTTIPRVRNEPDEIEAARSSAGVHDVGELLEHHRRDAHLGFDAEHRARRDDQVHLEVGHLAQRLQHREPELRRAGARHPDDDPVGHHALRAGVPCSVSWLVLRATRSGTVRGPTAPAVTRSSIASAS